MVSLWDQGSDSGLQKVGIWKLHPSSPVPGLTETESEKKTKQNKKRDLEKHLTCAWNTVSAPCLVN